MFALALGIIVIAATGLVAPGAARAATEPPREGCRGPADSVAVADALLQNRYTLATFKTVTLPANPTWAEDPLHNVNWLFNYHSLRFVLALTTAWTETGDTRYLDRAAFLLWDWYHDNPRGSAPSSWAWDEHSTAWRATVYVCAAEIMPASTWLTRALVLHGNVLADPAFYRGEGNHALNQDIGLLEVGCHMDRADWMHTAATRMTSLIGASVDSAGTINEQSVFYEYYNYTRYTFGSKRLVECGQPVSSVFARVALMPTFLAHATYPNGTWVPLGDTQASRAQSIAGTPAEFAATQGASGPKPTSTSRVYGAGFAFVRTGWGESRPYADETMISIRFGPARRFHGHDDGTSVTLYGYGGTVLHDSGVFDITAGAYRRYFIGRAAHNLVTVDGLTALKAATSVRWKRSSSTMFELAMTQKPYTGVTSQRRVTFSRQLGYVLVEDRLSATKSRTFRQLWHLREGSRPTISGSRTWTRSTGSNVLIVQLIAPAAVRTITGATSPIQGWLSYRGGTKVAAPVVEARRSGTSVKFLTLLVPYAATKPVVTVSDLRLITSGYALTVTIDGHRERVAAGTSDSRIVSLP